MVASLESSVAWLGCLFVGVADRLHSVAAGRVCLFVGAADSLRSVGSCCILDPEAVETLSVEVASAAVVGLCTSVEVQSAEVAAAEGQIGFVVG